MATKILVVDDDVDSLKLIGLMLQRQGYEVEGANSGSQALDKANAERPDLIILDVMMPDMDGYTVARELRSNSHTDKIPIIMFTAKTLIDDKVAGFEAGADDYLTKPTHPAELASRVKAILARSAAARRGQDAVSRSFAFIGAKGGIGTTTLAANIGAILAERGPTSLVDFRLGQGALGLSLGLGRSTGLANVASRPPAEINAQSVESELVTHNSGLRLLLSSSRPRENQLSISQEAAIAVINALGELSNNVLVDLGAGLNRLSARILREVNLTVLTVEPNRISMAMARNLLDELRQIGLNDSHIFVAIINRTPSGIQLSWQDAERILGNNNIAMISPAPELAFQAAESGVPLVRYQPDAIIVNQFSKLAEEVLKRASEA
jgi:CheY-like chemotaxis protein/MinD-like ATPase involved in chromosome partitioning or flagellar assembly